MDDMGVSMNGGSPIAGWFIRNNPSRMDDLGVPLVQEISICSLFLEAPEPPVQIEIGQLHRGFPVKTFPAIATTGSARRFAAKARCCYSNSWTMLVFSPVIWGFP